MLTGAAVVITISRLRIVKGELKLFFNVRIVGRVKTASLLQQKNSRRSPPLEKIKPEAIFSEDYVTGGIFLRNW